eukprot:gb/GECH01010969.1/.p1 GENE.gb/GECH01010969.1/~~gb/GECH01010969.1/.p1  ORF type:complete len:194 (+),score=26.82 gb/GECH01010969.1/:1-582(+)
MGKNKINLLNLGSVKSTLDETIKEIIENKVSQEDNSLIVIETIVNLLISALAVYAYFYPYPKDGSSRSILGACCVVYWLVMSVLYFISNYVVHDCILITKADGDSKAVRVNTKLEVDHTPDNQAAVPEYSLTIQTINRKQTGILTKYTEQCPNASSVAFLINEYFDEEGTLNKKKLNSQVNELLESVLEKKMN